MRAIDADALLEQYGIRDATKYGNKNAEQQNKSYSTLMMYEIADMIYDAPTIEPPAKWTPCSVELPEEGVNVRLTIESKTGTLAPFLGKTNRWECDAVLEFGEWSANVEDGLDEDDTVLAWYIQPEPYRGEA